MARKSARAKLRPIKMKRRSKPRAARGKKAPRRASRLKIHRARRGKVRVVRSRSTGARKSVRPLPSPDPLSERLFLGSLDRSLRDHRALWEALAKR